MDNNNNININNKIQDKVPRSWSNSAVWCTDSTNKIVLPLIKNASKYACISLAIESFMRAKTLLE